LKHLPKAPDFERHVIRDVALDDVWRFLNPAMLYGKHLGLKGNIKNLICRGDETALGLKRTVEELQDFCRDGKMHARAVWRFFPAAAEGNRVFLYSPEREEIIAEFGFPRQSQENGRCLADYLREPACRPRDSMALFAVTAGEGIRKLAKELKEQGEYLKSHAIQALALETAEATAEWLHRELRTSWGIPDDPKMPAGVTFKEKYRGKRYSPGYPACPNLDDQKTIFSLLAPGDIGIRLTEGLMMDPEASVSAMVFHHPDASYFSVL